MNSGVEQELRETISKLKAERDYLLQDHSAQIPGSGALRSMETGANTMGIAKSAFSPEQILTKIFSYQDDPRKIPNYVAIRTAAKHFAEVVLQNAPGCPDRTRALNAIRDTVMLANAAVALDGLSFNSL